MGEQLHADYLAVPKERQWNEPLDKLFPVLRREAWAARGAWCWRVLPRGALVSVRIAPPEAGKESAFHLELRLARKQAPTDAAGWQRWTFELSVFLKTLSGDAGDWQETQRSADKAEATFRFRLRGERPPTQCTRCGTRTVAQPGLFAADLCETCAMELGNEDAARLNAEHQREIR